MNQNTNDIGSMDLNQLNSFRENLDFTGYIKEYIHLGLDIDKIGNYHSKYSLLGWAIHEGSINDVELLINHQVNVNALCKENYTALEFVSRIIETIKHSIFPGNFDANAYEKNLHQIYSLLQVYQEKQQLDQNTLATEKVKKNIGQKI